MKTEQIEITPVAIFKITTDGDETFYQSVIGVIDDEGEIQVIRENYSTLGEARTALDDLL